MVIFSVFQLIYGLLLFSVGCVLCSYIVVKLAKLSFLGFSIILFFCISLASLRRKSSSCLFMASYLFPGPTDWLFCWAERSGLSPLGNNIEELTPIIAAPLLSRFVRLVKWLFLIYPPFGFLLDSFISP